MALPSIRTVDFNREIKKDNVEGGNICLLLIAYNSL